MTETSHSEKPALAKKETNEDSSSYLSKSGVIIFSVAIISALILGWENKSESYIDAEDGLGYALGIIGGSFMLILLLYPARKKARFMRRWGPIKYWFRTHMMLGVLGPVAIIFHSNFSLGSLNSNVALGCMILVSSSGLIGRYLYKRIHKGLYGRKLTFRELGKENEKSKDRLENALGFVPKIHDDIEDFEKHVFAPANGVIGGVLHYMANNIRAVIFQHRLLSSLNKALKTKAKEENWNKKDRRSHYKETHRFLKNYFSAMYKVSEFKIFERLFALWHILHLPLFIMLVISGFVHVYAVHVY